MISVDCNAPINAYPDSFDRSSHSCPQTANSQDNVPQNATSMWTLRANRQSVKATSMPRSRPITMRKLILENRMPSPKPLHL